MGEMSHRNYSFKGMAIPPMPADDIGKQIYRELLSFILDDRREFVRLCYKCSKYRRRQCHLIAEQFDCLHLGSGEKELNRHVVVYKRGTPNPERGKKIDDNDEEAKKSSKPQPAKEEIRKIFEDFLSKEREVVLNFPTWYDHNSRRLVHQLAEEYPQLDHDSFGEKHKDRYVRITKVDEKILQKRREKMKGLNVAYQFYLDKVKEEGTHNQEKISKEIIRNMSTPKKEDHVFRVMQFNIEWMDYFYESDTKFHKKNEKADIHNVDALCTNIASSIKTLDPDVLFVEEGPSSKERMELFVKTYLGNDYIVLGGMERLTQQLYLLVKKNGPVQNAQLFEPGLKFLNQPFFFDIDGDKTLHEYKVRRGIEIER